MPRRHRSAGRSSRGPLKRLAVPVAIPVALIVAAGAIAAIVAHSGASSISDTANASCASSAATAPAATVTPLAAVNQLWNDVQTGQSNGQIRSDVALDLENLIQPVRSDIQAGQVQPSQISQFVTSLQAKIATRSAEAGAITASAATQLDNDLTQLGNRGRPETPLAARERRERRYR